MSIIYKIYKISNLVTGKVYIGQTKSTLRNRFISGHKSNAARGSDYHIHRSMRKHGFDNFNITLIEKCSVENVNDREIYWINHYNSTDRKYGYNIALGGKNFARSTDPLFMYHLEIINLLKTTTLTYKQIGDNYNVGRHIIGLINQGKRWSVENIEYPIRGRVNKKPKECKICGVEIQPRSTYCMDHNPSYDSRIPSKDILEKYMIDNDFNKSKVSVIYGVSDNTIKKWCIKYKIKYKRDKIIKTRKILEIPKEVWMIDKDSKEVIKVFKSVKDANLHVGSKYNDGNISRCVRGIRNSAHGFKWQFKY